MILENIDEGAKINNQKGFTLMEIMIALFIFTFGVLAVTLLQTAALNGTDIAKRKAEALSLTSSQVEQILGTRYTTLQSGTMTQGDYTLTWTVDAEVNNTKQVHVRVDWLNKGNPASITYNILRGQNI